MAFFDMIGEKITNTVSGTTNKAKEIGEIQRLNSSIASNKALLNERFAGMGRYYFDNFKANGSIGELNKMSEEIIQILETIDQLEVKVNAMKGRRKCDVCGEYIEETNTFCPKCGGKQSVVIYKCINCKSILDANTRFCPKCGAKQPGAGTDTAAAAPEPVNAPEPVVEAVPEPVVEAVPEPVVEAAPEPVVEAVPEPVVEAAPEPVVEAVPEPVVEAVPEPVVEAVPEPVVEAVPDENSAKAIVPDFVPASSSEGIVPEIVRCPACGMQLDEDSAFCPECGAPISKGEASDKKICPSCGNAEDSDTLFCSQCGTKL